MKTDEKQTCQTCGYFRRHYIWFEQYTWVNCGHCTHPPRNRQCRPGMAACGKWTEQPEDYRERFLPTK